MLELKGVGVAEVAVMPPNNDDDEALFAVLNGVDDTFTLLEGTVDD
jgi:hypothetical protein